MIRTSFFKSYNFTGQQKKFVEFPFLDENGERLNNSPVCGLTLRAGGSMRFRWNEENPGRDKLLGEIVDNKPYVFVPVQLGHTKIVYKIDGAGDTLGKIGDGMITQNRMLVPTVTVADCVPIYLFDSKTGAFGIVHSGWKGTGIGAEAIKLAGEEFCSRPEDFYVVIGPHIKSCCYIVNEERANYFAENFTPDCVSELENGVSVDWNSGGGKLYRLALDKANVAMFMRAGVPDNHITVYDDCTCCNDVFGSNRRETKAAGKPNLFTVMAAFIAY